MHSDLLMLAMVLAAALAGGWVASRLGYPSILGEIVAGIVLGPPLLGLLSSNEAIDVLGEFGVLLMMLYIGVHLDLGDLRRASRPGLFAAIGGFLVPTALGMALMFAVGRSTIEAIFVGVAMGVTSLIVNSRILVDLKLLDTRIALVLVGGAILSDVAVLVIFAALLGQEGAGGDFSAVTALVTAGKAILFAVGAWLVGGVVLPWVKRSLGDRELDKGALLLTVIVLGLVFSWAAELAGLHAILGAFAAGLFIDRHVLDAKASRDLQQKLATISIGVLAPFFFVSAGFEVSFAVITQQTSLLIWVIVVATVGKVVGTAIFYLFSGNGWREGLVIGAGMNGRGAVEIILAEIALAQGLIERDIFSILVFMALFTTATVPVLLTAGVRWLRRRGELVKASGRHRILVIGANPLVRALASNLGSPAITMLDTNRQNLLEAERLAFTTVQGNALDEAALETAGIDESSLVIAATANAEVNVLVAQLSRELGVPEVVVLLTENDASTLSGRLERDDIEIVRMPNDTAEWVAATGAGHATVVSLDLTGPEFDDETLPLDSTARAIGAPLLPLVVVSKGERRLFTGQTDLLDADELICLRREPTIRQTEPGGVLSGF